jgi:hypothetical protein
MTEPNIEQPQSEPLSAEKMVLDPNVLRTGFVIGIDDEGKLFYSSCGHQEVPNLYELIGLADTALAVFKYLRDGYTPSTVRNVKELGLGIERLVQTMVMSQQAPQEKDIIQ